MLSEFAFLSMILSGHPVSTEKDPSGNVKAPFEKGEKAAGNFSWL